MPSKLNSSGCCFHGNHSHNDGKNHGSNYLHQLQVAPTHRRGPIGAEFSSPGPAIVSLPSVFGPNSRSPAFTFGSKHEDKKDNKTPGPGEYDVEGLTRMGKDWTPAAFVSPKYKYPEPFNTPSPTQYSPEKSIYVAKGRQAPSYTFGHKFKDHVPDATPAPTSYNAEKVWINKTSHPSMSFGSRPSPYALSF
jgi:hypothetical protein